MRSLYARTSSFGPLFPLTLVILGLIAMAACIGLSLNPNF